jgi:hypothetical protein
MSLVLAPNRPQRHHLAVVTEAMRILGAPAIRAYWIGDHWLALEGSHRLAADFDPEAHYFGEQRVARKQPSS